MTLSTLKNKPPTGLRDMYQRAEAVRIARERADYNAEPLIEIIRHRCPDCSKPIDLPMRGRDMNAAAIAQTRKLAAMVRCDTCCAFNSGRSQVAARLRKIDEIIFRHAAKLDAYRARIDRTDDDAEQHELRKALIDSEAIIANAWQDATDAKRDGAKLEDGFQKYIARTKASIAPHFQVVGTQQPPATPDDDDVDF
tara:strand:- start:475 stop:1062 length:588 start_codon:yes stop_codon:yes gene_type:complete